MQHKFRGLQVLRQHEQFRICVMNHFHFGIMFIVFNDYETDFETSDYSKAIEWFNSSIEDYNEYLKEYNEE